MPETTTLQIVTADITNITVGATQTTAVTVSNSDSTILLATPATITTNQLNFSDALATDIARTANSGVAELASRSDHVHSLANTLLDGGNY